MMSVKDIIKDLCDKHLREVRIYLEKDTSYNKFTLAIFDAYQQGYSEKETLNELSLTETSFKVFERVIERAIYNYYGIVDSSIQDMIFSSIFYGIYGNSKKTDSERTVELEGLFHSLKQFNLDEESYFLTNKLYQLNINTPLGPVYKHLSNKYLAIGNKNTECLNTFIRFNQVLTNLVDSANGLFYIKDLIYLYKKIRSQYIDNINNTTKTIYYLCKFICVSVANQNQLLKDADLSIDELAYELSVNIKALPFGMDRYYMNNIYLHVYSNYLSKKGEDLLANHFLKKKTDCQLFESYNFNFPNHISKEITTQDKTTLIQLKKIESDSTIKNSISNFSNENLKNRDYFPYTFQN